jgi:hypothetical protein
VAGVVMDSFDPVAKHMEAGIYRAPSYDSNTLWLFNIAIEKGHL